MVLSICMQIDILLSLFFIISYLWSKWLEKKDAAQFYSVCLFDKSTPLQTATCPMSHKGWTYKVKQPNKLVHPYDKARRY